MPEIAKVLGIKDYTQPFVEQVFQQAQNLYLKNEYMKAVGWLVEAIHWPQETTEEATWKKKTAALDELCRYLETFESQGENAQLDTEKFHDLTTEYFATQDKDYGPKEVLDKAAASDAVTEIRNLIAQNRMSSYKKAWDYFFDTTQPGLEGNAAFKEDKLFLPEHSFIIEERERLKKQVIKGIIALQEQKESLPYWPDGVERQELLAAISASKESEAPPPGTPDAAKDQPVGLDNASGTTALTPKSNASYQTDVTQPSKQKSEDAPPIPATTTTADAMESEGLEKIEKKISQAMKLLKDFHFQAAYTLLHDSYPDLNAVEQKLPEASITTHLYPLAATKQLALQLNGFELSLELDIEADCPPKMKWIDYTNSIYTKINTKMANGLEGFELHEIKKAAPTRIAFGTRYEKLGHKPRYIQYFRHIFWVEFAECREIHRLYKDAQQNYNSSITKATEPFELNKESFPPLMKNDDQRIISLRQKVEEMKNLRQANTQSKQDPNLSTQLIAPSTTPQKEALESFSLEERITETIAQINSFRLIIPTDTEAFGQRENHITLLSIADNMQSIIRDRRANDDTDIQKEINKMCESFVNMSNGIENSNDLRKVLGVTREIANALNYVMPGSPTFNVMETHKNNLKSRLPAAR